MIPPKWDPRWPEFLDKLEIVPLKYLGSKMLATRLRILDWRASDAKRNEAIAAAHEFFAKNETIFESDVKLIFG
jgi:hypothetical protein